MSNKTPTPRLAAKKLLEGSEKVKQFDPSIQQDMREGAESIEYLLILLNECAAYIEGVREYDKPPRFIIAVREALK
ncbi:MAG: hypothetical protein J0L96_05905 [Anaerolineae bacterium]|nr:hypothetical protein [Anaerolineae bacterium]